MAECQTELLTIFIKPVLNTCCGPDTVLGSGDTDESDRVLEGGLLQSKFVWQYFCFSSESSSMFPLRGSAQSPFCLAGALTPCGAAAHPSLRATSAPAPLASAVVLHRT